MSRFHPSELPHKAHLQVLSALEELDRVLSWFDQFNHPALPYTVWLQCQLALAEGFTNAVRHAHKDQPATIPIDIEVILCDSPEPQQGNCTLELRIWDYGAEFNLSEAVEQIPQVTEDAEGGRGLKLMSKLADVLTYTRIANNRNCLLIVKNYPANSEAGAMGEDVFEQLSDEH
jgi:serine/threonine-protein kinase RsbW